MNYRDFITTVPGVQGGEPILRGTRTPVRSVAILYYETYPGDLSEVQRALPHLETIQIEAALAYYANHRSEIDASIREHEQALREHTSA